MLNNVDNLKKISQCMRYFDKYRNDNLVNYNKYFDRLCRCSIPSRYLIDRQSKKLLKNKVKHKSLHSIFILPFSNFFLRFLKKIPLFSKQYKRIKKSSQCGSNPNMVVGISPSRIKIKGSNIRQNLLDLTRILGDGSNLDYLVKGLNNEALVYLFDPQSESDLWLKYEEIQKQNMFIVDGGFILYISLRSILNINFSWFFKVASYLKCSKKYNKGFLPNNIYREVAVVFGINYFLKSLDNYRLVLLTSNSTTIEVLRCISLINCKCNSVLEICHGVLMDPTEEYIKNLSYLESHNRKQLFIPQVTGLPETKKVTMDYYYKNIAVNSYFNMFINDLGGENNGLKRFLEKNCNYLNINPDMKKNTVFTIFGGTNHEGDYYSSKSFEFEMMMMMIVKEYAENNNIIINILYAGHPANNIEGSDIGLDLINNDIFFTYNSMFCYLVSDFSASMLSSCIFEADWLDIMMYTPMMDSDRLFSRSYLDQVYHPKEDGYKAFSKSFIKFIDDGVRSKHDISFYKKAFNRVGKIYNKHSYSENE